MSVLTKKTKDCSQRIRFYSICDVTDIKGWVPDFCKVGSRGKRCSHFGSGKNCSFG
jgi:hypothetical protein